MPLGESLAWLPRQGGRLYIWVYSPGAETRTMVRRGMMLFERGIRPVVSRLSDRPQTAVLAPLVPLYMGYQGLRALRGGSTYVRYGVREALHAARDRFTPRYIHRHSDEEESSWFRAAGYDDITCDSRRARPEFVPVAFTANTGVSGIRQ